MPNTVRPLADILSLLADNTSGAISPQDLRDAIVSVFGNYSQLTGSGIVSGALSFKVYDMWTGSGPTSGCITPDHATTRRLTIDQDGVYDVSCFFVGSQATSRTMYMRVTKNGALIGTMTEGATGTQLEASVRSFVTLSAGDYLQLEVANSGAVFQTTSAQLRAVKIG